MRILVAFFLLSPHTFTNISPARWKSYTAPEKTVLMTNVQDSVFQLFQRVENKHGWMLVSHALAYVTAVSQCIITQCVSMCFCHKRS